MKSKGTLQKAIYIYKIFIHMILIVEAYWEVPIGLEIIQFILSEKTATGYRRFYGFYVFHRIFTT